MEEKKENEENEVEEEGEFAIAGGGLAGLALALRLQQEGRQVDIYERDISFTSRAQGYSISVQLGGKTAFKKLNLLHKIEEYPCRSMAYETLSSDGRRVFCRPFIIKKEKESFLSNPIPVPIPRQLLREFLLNELKEGTILWNCSVLRYSPSNKINNNNDNNNYNDNNEISNNDINNDNNNSNCLNNNNSNHKINNNNNNNINNSKINNLNNNSDNYHINNNNKIRVYLSNGKSKLYRGLIGCDGLRSKIRDQLIGDKLHYLGVYAINGIAKYSSEFDHLLKNRSIQSINGLCRIFIKPFDEFSSMWQLTFPIAFSDQFSDVDNIKININNNNNNNINNINNTIQTNQLNNKNDLKIENGSNNENKTKRKRNKNKKNENKNNKTEEEMMKEIIQIAPEDDLEILTKEEISLLISNSSIEPSRLLEISRRYLRKFHNPILDLVMETDPSNVRGGFYFDRDPIDVIPAKDNNLVTLIGDAAHPMSPFKGQGANQALLDAMELVDTLIENNWKIEESFSKFEEKMWSRTKKFVLGSRGGVEFLHTPLALHSSSFRSFLIENNRPTT